MDIFDPDDPSLTEVLATLALVAAIILCVWLVAC